MRRTLPHVVAASPPTQTLMRLLSHTRRVCDWRRSGTVLGASDEPLDNLGIARSAAPRARRRLSTVTGHRRFSDFVPGYDPDHTGSLRLSFVASCRPHPNKVARGGEDGYFACPDSSSFGIADGVGGWAETGADPGEFARRLLQFAYEDLRCRNMGRLQQVFDAAAKRIHIAKVNGGSTLLLGQLESKTLTVLNLGDSGILVLRPAMRSPPGSETLLLYPRIVFRSSDQTHYFNCPYQLGSGHGHIEVPDLIQIQVREGDIVIAATDGVFDNLFDRQLQQIVARHLGDAWRTGEEVEPHLQSLASNVVEHSQKIGKLDDATDIFTPFALSAHAEGLSYRGGKLDDTTAVVGLVCRSHGEPVSESLLDTSNVLPVLHNWRI